MALRGAHLGAPGPGGYWFTSVMTTWRAPQWRAIATAMMPIGPAPVMSTSSPTTLNASAVCVALPNGSRMEAISSSMAGESLNTLLAGSVRYSRESARPVHADTQRVAAQVAPPGAAVAAMSAGDVAFARHPVAGLEAAHLAADLDDLARILVTHGHRHRHGLLRPRVPVVDMHVGAADGGAVDLDEDVVVADRGLRHVLHPDSRFRPSFDQCFHEPALLNDAELAPARARTPGSRDRAATVECAALNCVRIRALPCGTTGKENATT